MQELRSLLEKLMENHIEDLKFVHQDVNSLYRFVCDKTHYYCKLMTRKPLNEVEHHRFLRAQQLLEYFKDKIPVPHIVHVDIEQQNIDTNEVYALMIMEEVPGQPLDTLWETLDQENKISLARDLAKILRAIHSTKSVDVFDSVPKGLWEGKPTWVEYLAHKFDKAVDVLMNLDRVSKGVLYKASLFVHEKLSEIDNVSISESTLLHQDLWAGNAICINDSQVSITGLIDWEWSIVGGDAYYDLTYFETELLFGDEKALEVFSKEYGLDEQLFAQRKALYNVIQYFVGGASGYLYHHPSEEGYQNLENQVLRIVEARK